MCFRCGYYYACFYPCCQVVADNILPSLQNIEELIERGEYQAASNEIGLLRGQEALKGKIYQSRLKRLQGEFALSNKIIEEVINSAEDDVDTLIVALIEMATLVWHQQKYTSPGTIYQVMIFPESGVTKLTDALGIVDQGIELSNGLEDNKRQAKLFSTLLHVKGLIHFSLQLLYTALSKRLRTQYHRNVAWSKLAEQLTEDEKTQYDLLVGQSISTDYEASRLVFRQNHELRDFLEETKEKWMLKDVLNSDENTGYLDRWLSPNIEKLIQQLGSQEYEHYLLIKERIQSFKKLTELNNRVLARAKKARASRPLAPLDQKSLDHQKMSDQCFRRSLRLRKSISNEEDYFISLFHSFLTDIPKVQLHQTGSFRYKEYIMTDFNYKTVYEELLSMAEKPSSTSMKRLATILFLPLARRDVQYIMLLNNPDKFQALHYQNLIEQYLWDVSNGRDSVLFREDTKAKIDYYLNHDPELKVRCNQEWIAKLFREIARHTWKEDLASRAMIYYAEALLLLDKYDSMEYLGYLIDEIAGKQHPESTSDIPAVLEQYIVDRSQIAQALELLEKSTNAGKALCKVSLINDKTKGREYVETILKHAARLTSDIPEFYLKYTKNLYNSSEKQDDEPVLNREDLKNYLNEAQDLLREFDGM